MVLPPRRPRAITLVMTGLKKRLRAGLIAGSMVVAALTGALSGAGAARAAEAIAGASAAEAVATQQPGPDHGLVYHVYAGGLRVLTLRSDLAFGAERYDLSFTGRSDGILAALLHFVISARAVGEFSGQDLAPQAYYTANRWRWREARWVEIDYRGDAVSALSMPLPGEDDRPPVPAELQAGTIDPLSALFQVLVGVGAGESCTGGARVFDGRRLYQVEAARVAETELPESRIGVHAGTALECRLTISRQTGFWNDAERRKYYPTVVSVWLADIVDGLPPVPVRAEAETSVATIVVHLVHVEEPGDGRLARDEAGGPAETALD